MKWARMMMAMACLIALGFAQGKGDEGPTNEKAQKTYRQAQDYMHQRMIGPAFEAFMKADKQDGGHCARCQREVIKLGEQLGEWKAVEAAAEEQIADATQPREAALAHYDLGMILFNEGQQRHKDEFFSRAHEEMTKALAAAPKFPAAVFADGRALAHLKQDDAAKARFAQFVEMQPEDSPDRQRAMLFMSQPELARALMAPPFAVTTLDGKKISLDDLQGKVVLIDFWATWCEPCREALPHVKEIAKKFDGQPLTVLSISVDTDEQKWKAFVAKNEMTWPQYIDHGFTGPVAKSFGVEAIPHTFTIDADGILQDEHIGDSSIEGKLKKLVKRAQEKQATQRPQQAQ
ncbi:MAG: TlpA disulfide reductase family protein [Candidatus Sulfotelmatobacter sp.]